MQRPFRVPEIAIGFLAAAAFFSVASVLVPEFWPAHQGHQKHSERGSAITAEEHSPDKITDWLLVVLNVFLVGSTVALWRANNRSAEISARALTDLERPWIFVHLRPHLQYRPGYDERLLRHQVINGPDPTDETPLAVFDIANHGRMPGTVQTCRAILGSVPVTLDADRHLAIPTGLIRDEFQGAIGPAEKRTGLFLDCPAGLEYSVTVDLVTEEFHPIPTIPNDELFIFWIQISYVDVAGNPHESSFCWQYDFTVSHWVQGGGSKYNYQT